MRTGFQGLGPIAERCKRVSFAAAQAIHSYIGGWTYG
jgi:hypothetical protein